MLKKLPIFIAGVSLIATSVMAQSSLKTENQQASYAIGLQLGQQLSISKENVDLEALKLGIQDTFSGTKPRVTNDQMRKAMMAFQEKTQKKQQALLAKLGQEGDAFRKANKKKKGVVTLPSGLQYKVLKKGTGKVSPKATDTVVTHYHGTLPNGVVFDSSYERGTPATFAVNGVIKGWTEALQKMKVGDKWQLVLPPELAYGARGAGQKIGPNATLVFDVELLEIK